MPAVSISQQGFMGQVYAVRKWMDSDGKEGLNPKDIDKKYRKKIVDTAKNWEGKKSLKSYASTKHEGLPQVKEESEVVEEKDVPTIYPYLDPDSKKKKNRNPLAKMQNLVDYREFIKNK